MGYSQTAEEKQVRRYKSVCHVHDDVVDWDVDKLDEETNESHHGESYGGGNGNLLEL
jgi:hypothetical protein